MFLWSKSLEPFPNSRCYHRSDVVVIRRVGAALWTPTARWSVNIMQLFISRHLLLRRQRINLEILHWGLLIRLLAGNGRNDLYQNEVWVFVAHSKKRLSERDQLPREGCFLLKSELVRLVQTQGAEFYALAFGWRWWESSTTRLQTTAWCWWRCNERGEWLT